MDFVIGTALIIPGPHTLPLTLGLAAFKSIQGLRQRRRLRRSASSVGSLPGGSASNEVLLEWRDLTCTLTDKKTGEKRLLLNNVAGSAAPGRLTAIMGPSGSGKTTLLSCLAGQMPYSRAITLQGNVTANGVPLQASKLRAGFVQQDDLFYPQLTVKETLMMAAELRMSREASAEEKEAYVDGIISRLGLAKAANTPVGDAKTRGLSGGEKKRLSIAVELISRPMMVFADEPTSGLDAFSAEMAMATLKWSRATTGTAAIRHPLSNPCQVMATLKELCSDGHTVMVSIHQPRSSVFSMFDDLVLMAEGELVYAGPAAEVLPHFQQLGHTCPEHYNPAEWLADLVAIDHSSPETEAESKARLHALTAAWSKQQHQQHQQQQQQQPSGDATAASSGSLAAVAAGGEAVGMSHRPSCGLRRQVSLLFGRSLRQVLRDRATNVGRASSQVSSALVFASIYWRMKRSQSSIQDRMGLLQISAVGSAMTSLIKTLNVFPREKTLVGRERARAGYGVLPYLLSKLAAELPVGALFPALFACLVYPTTGLNPKPQRFANFLGLLTLEAMSAQALGLAVGAAAPSTEAALAIGPAVILVSIVFGGLFVNKANVPKPLKWLPATSLIKQAFEGACINEFRGAEFEPDERGGGTRTGEEVLERLSFSDSSLRRTMANQGRIMMAYWWYTYCILVRKQPKYQPLLPPSASTSFA